ncbi:hypothetical protein [Taylorella asinigenitalis]|uniref:Uncharacterized protein n=1 Tax=Taylorella asinigenitalis (strain MCE3) TaxID=1008459 RepID=G4QDG1_TAYAM|nr:hypothetical protein [Taylorella asinigenitalis]AEP35978.1 hypothetical protein TASI_0187 [Taylorella asinigenitalis MCE3]
MAITNNATLSESTSIENRLWGGVKFVSGVVEMLVAGGLCLKLLNQINLQLY